MICGKCNAELADHAHFCPNCRSVFMYQGETKEQVAELVRQEYQQYLQQQQELQEQTRREQQEAWQEIERARAEIESQREQLAAQQQEIQAQREQLAAQGQQLQVQQQLAQQQAAQTTPKASPAKAAEQQQENKPTSGLAVASLVLGILAIGTSFVPIVNNWSFFIAIVGLFFSLVGLGDTGKVRQNRGRGLAVSGLVLSIASIVIVLVTQSFFASAFNQFADKVQHGEKPVASSMASVDYSQMSIGQSVTLENGMTVRVNDVERGVQSLYSGELTRVNVTYENGSKSNSSFNTLDWKAENGSGVLNMATVFSGSDSDLGSGQLTPGGNVTGDIYFEGDIAKVYYYSNTLIQSDSSICWIVG